MQLAFCIYKYFPHGGIQRDLMKISGEAVARGHQVRVYAIQWNASLPDNLDVRIFPATAFTSHRRYARFNTQVLEHVAEHPVDLLVGMNKMPGLDVYYAGDSCYAEKAATQRGALYRQLPRYRHFSRFERAVFEPRATTRILTISEVETENFRRHYGTPRERFHPLPPGIERDRVASSEHGAIRRQFRTEFAVADTEHLLLFIGSGFIKKGLDRALLALEALPADLGEKTRMFVVGNDNPAKFRRLANRLGISGRVRFFSGRDDVPRFLFGADALVLPAYDETAGIVILEAMFAGLPALVSGNCGYAVHLAQSGAGLISPTPFDQQRFNTQLVELLTSSEREHWSSRGRAAAGQPEFFQLAQKAVDLLERFAREKAAATNPGASEK
jgi:UDP-glucose:(heptosyl)LPS alpha-1,3-glucosyltransferase